MECPICMCDDASIKLKCSHSFCGKCAKEWFTRNEVATCPMCRGPFKFKGMDAWVSEKNERDVLFEDGVNMILEANRVYMWETVNMNGRNVMYGKRVSKIQKLDEFQRAYNEISKYYYEWDEEDFEMFVLNEDISEWLSVEKPEYHDEPLPEWVTKYPMIY